MVLEGLKGKNSCLWQEELVGMDQTTSSAAFVTNTYKIF